MKAFTLASILLATTLSITTHAAPAAALDSSVTNDDTALLKLVVNYNEDAAAVLIAKYDAAFTGTSAPKLSRSALKAGTTSSFVTPFCVGVASNPVRNQVFANKLTCDQDGWKTLYIFTAFADPDPYQGFNETCVAYALNPTRSLLFNNTLTCNQGEWKTDFHFYQSGCLPSQNDVNCVRRQSTTLMWQNYNPHRIVMYPWYPGNLRGWKDAITVRYLVQWRYAKEEEWKSLTDVMTIHAALHSRTTITATTSDPIRRCLRNLFQMYPWGSITTAVTYPGNFHPGYPAAATRDACSEFANTTSFVVNPQFQDGYASVNAMVGSKIYASVTMPLNKSFNRQLVPLAFEESLRTKFSIPIGSVVTRPDAIVAMVQKKFIVMGGPEAYNGAADI
ncbi:MAG: hypothetical protein J3R72DRAFT_523133 [Linnemannia gamsii]|nr:MAG: hypothetical protein J3R72DRAFT_523133 [Linnemannia gamsii]